MARLVAQRRRGGAQEADEVADEARGLRRVLLGSCCALPSVLNRKCGSICSCSSFSFDSASWRDSWLWRASRLQDRRERAVFAVAQVGDQRDHERVQESEHEPAGDDVAQQRAVVQPVERI